MPGRPQLNGLVERELAPRAGSGTGCLSRGAARLFPDGRLLEAVEAAVQAHYLTKHESTTLR